MPKVLQFVRDLHVYPNQLGLSRECKALWRRWRSVYPAPLQINARNIRELGISPNMGLTEHWLDVVA